MLLEGQRQQLEERIQRCVALLREGLPGADVDGMIQQDPALLLVDVQPGECSGGPVASWGGGGRGHRGGQRPYMCCSAVPCLLLACASPASGGSQRAPGRCECRQRAFVRYMLLLAPTPHPHDHSLSLDWRPRTPAASSLPARQRAPTQLAPPAAAAAAAAGLEQLKQLWQVDEEALRESDPAELALAVRALSKAGAPKRY